MPSQCKLYPLFIAPESNEKKEYLYAPRTQTLHTDNYINLMLISELAGELNEHERTRTAKLFFFTRSLSPRSFVLVNLLLVRAQKI